MTARNFSLLNDKPLTSEVAIASWCPTMDLVALVTADGQLLLHRLNWQRLWIHSPESLITCVCWRPDGKVLATGHKDGSVTLHDVENGEIKSKRKLHKAAICAISWVEGAPTTGAAQGAGQRREPLVNLYFPPKSGRKEQTQVSSSTGSNKHIDLVLPVQPRQLTILVTADSSSTVILSAFGQVRIAEFNMAEALQDKAPFGVIPQPCKVALLRDLQHIVVVHQDAAATAGEALLTVFHTDVIAAHSADVRDLAEASSKVVWLLQGAHKSVDTCVKEWRTAMQDFQKQVTALRISMEDHGMKYVDPQAELLCLLATGTMSPAGSAWLTGQLGETSLRRLARTIDTAVSNIHSQQLDQLQPMCEIVGFLLGELKGLSRCRGRLEPLGLQEEVINAAEQVCMQLLVSSNTLRLSLVEVGAKYRSFFSWLLHTIRQMDEEARLGPDGPASAHIAAISDFLSKEFMEDSIGPKLGGAGFHSPDSGSSATRVSKLMHIMYGNQTLASGKGVAELLGASLQAQVKELVQICTTAFLRPCEAISPSISPLFHVPLLPPPAPLSPMSLHDTSPPRCLVLNTPQTTAEGKESHSYLACLAPSPPSLSGDSCLLILRMSWQDKLPQETVEGLVVRLPSRLQVVDVAFYKAAQVVLLLDGWSEDITAPVGERSCCLLMMPFPEEHLTTLAIDGGQTELLQACLTQGAVVDLPTVATDPQVRQRLLAYSSAQAPLAVSAPRGVACVFAAMQHVLMWDLEEDEDEMEAGDEEDMEEEEVE